MPSTRVFGFQIWNNELVRFKQDLGLKPGPKIDIEIPSLFLINQELKTSVLRGIFDTDGCIYLEKKNHKLYPRIQIVTISIKLANQLRDLFIELGFRATMYKDHLVLREKQKMSYVITIRGEEIFHRFMRTIDPKNPKHLAKYHKFLESKSL
ncbi:MAG: LAGLIDADG family homing endonuclease [Nanoarchaeota archaeon]|nr:LAGLIDADG family homing endonuclease [Nanoarchaeota archaeon]